MKIILLIFLTIQLACPVLGQYSGRVIDDNGIPIQGVHVSTSISDHHSITNIHGEFSIAFQKSEYILFSHLNYHELAFHTTDSLPKNIKLTKKEHYIEEIQVTGFHLNQSKKINKQSLNRLPTLLGEKDIVKFMATLPGIVTVSALDAGVYVRGGDSNQNAFLVDGVPIASPQHITGILSTFDPFVLDKTSIYKSSFPTALNGALSAYINMMPSDYSATKFSGELQLGLLSSSFRSKFTVKNKTTITLSARSSYFQWVAQKINTDKEKDLIPPYRYSDLSLSVVSKLNDTWKLNNFIQFSSDALPIELGNNSTHDLKWKTASWVSSIKNKASKKNRFEFKVGANQNDNNTNSTSKFSIHNKSKITNYYSSIGYRRKFTKRFSFRIGFSLETKQFNHHQTRSTGVSENQFTQWKEEYTQLSNWSEIRLQLPHYFTFTCGLNTILFNSRFKDIYASPRIKLEHKKENFCLWLDYSHTLQTEEHLPVFTIKSPIDLQLVIEPNTPPAISHLFTLGGKKIVNQNFHFSISTFYKQLLNVKNFVSPDRTELSNLSKSVITGDGKAYGIESDAVFKTPKVYLRAAYTYSTVQHRFAELNKGKVFFPPYDMRHNGLLNASFQLSESLRFDAIWRYSTGTRVTLPVGIASIKDVNRGTGMNFVPIYTDQYNYQMPAMHRLDININYSFPFIANTLEFDVGVFNVYNRNNPTFVYIEPENSSKYTIKFTPKSKNFSPFMPYFSIVYKFKR